MIMAKTADCPPFFKCIDSSLIKVRSGEADLLHCFFYTPGLGGGGRARFGERMKEWG